MVRNSACIYELKREAFFEVNRHARGEDLPSTGKSSCFIDCLDPLSGLIQVELVLEAGQIRAGLLDKAFREWRIFGSG